MKKTNFDSRNKKLINLMSNDKSLKKLSKKMTLSLLKYEYIYHFSWLSRPIIQFPQDIIAFQEIIWKTKPDLIIETGIARGGSLIFFSSILELIGKGQVIGIDNNLRKHNEIVLKKHPLSSRIKILKGSSIEPKIIQKIKKFAKNKENIMIVLDSDHSKNHVLQELSLFSPLVSKGNYIVVCDTILEELPNDWLQKNKIDRPWNKSDNPKTAVWEFLKQNNRFKIDKKLENKLLITTAPDGFLKCIKNY